MADVRQPAVAGMFYEDDPKELNRSIEASFLGPLGPGRLPEADRKKDLSGAGKREGGGRDIAALVSPHAGYQFSGYAAAAAFLELAEDGIPDSAVIIGPNHRGIGAPAAAAREGAWRTPLGDVQIDTDLADLILSGSQYLVADPSAHWLEHSLEVQVPFLQYLAGARTKIVPIVISALAPEDSRSLVADLGQAVASALVGISGVVIASTDFTHYEPKASAERKDGLAIGAIEQLDPQKLLQTVEDYHVTMCGAVATAVALTAAKTLGAARAELLSYYTSGDVTGDSGQVVGYAALKIVRNNPKGV